MNQVTEAPSKVPLASPTVWATAAPDDMGSDDMGSDDIGSDDMGSDDIGSDDIGSDDIGSDDIGPDDMGADVAGPEDIGADAEDAMDMALEVVLDGAAALVDAPALTDDDPQAAVHTSTSPSAAETSAW